MRKRSYSIYGKNYQNYEAEVKSNPKNEYFEENESLIIDTSGLRGSPCLSPYTQFSKPRRKVHDSDLGEINTVEYFSADHNSEIENYFINNDQLLSFGSNDYKLSNKTSKSEDEMIGDTNQLLRLINASREEEGLSEQSDLLICKYFKEILTRGLSNGTETRESKSSCQMLHRIYLNKHKTNQRVRSLSFQSIDDVSIANVVSTVLSERFKCKTSQNKFQNLNLYKVDSPSKPKEMQRANYFSSTKSVSSSSKSKIEQSEPEIVNLEDIIIENAITRECTKVILTGKVYGKRTLISSINRCEDPESSISSQDK